MTAHEAPPAPQPLLLPAEDRTGLKACLLQPLLQLLRTAGPAGLPPLQPLQPLRPPA